MTDVLSHLEISTDARERAAENNEALPDGSYPIRNKGDLQRAIQSYGRASDKEKVKKWIIKRARELDAVEMLPESWNVEEIAHSDELMYHGVRGQKWGVRKPVDRVTTSKSDNKTTTPVEKDSDSTTTKNGGGGGGGSSDDDEADTEKDDAKDDGIPEGDTRKEFNERYSTSTPKSSYPARQSISKLLANVPSTTKTTSPAVQSIIDKINASVEARRKTVLITTEDEVQHTDESTGRNSAMTHEEPVAMGAESLDTLLQEKSNELAHYGVLGMKWGVRNDDRSSGRPQGGASRKKAPLSSVKKMVTSKPKATAQTTEQKTNESSSSTKGPESKVVETKAEPLSAKSMTDQELRDAVNRLQMEKTYAQLMAERNPAPAKKAESAIKTILLGSTKQAAGQLLTNTFRVIGTYAVAAAISKTNPSLANAMMKGVGDNAIAKKAATETETDDGPDATVNQPKQSSQPKQQKPATQTQSSTPKPTSQNSSSSTDAARLANLHKSVDQSLARNRSQADQDIADNQAILSRLEEFRKNNS